MSDLIFNSKADMDRCLKEDCFSDEEVILTEKIIDIRNGRTFPSREFILTGLNYKKNNYRYCQVRLIKDDNFVGGEIVLKAIKRTYSETLIVDMKKYNDYYEKEIKGLVEQSNYLISKDRGLVTIPNYKYDYQKLTQKDYIKLFNESSK